MARHRLEYRFGSERRRPVLESCGSARSPLPSDRQSRCGAPSVRARRQESTDGMPALSPPPFDRATPSCRGRAPLAIPPNFVPAGYYSNWLLRERSILDVKRRLVLEFARVIVG